MQIAMLFSFEMPSAYITVLSYPETQLISNIEDVSFQLKEQCLYE